MKNLHALQNLSTHTSEEQFISQRNLEDLFRLEKKLDGLT